MNTVFLSLGSNIGDRKSHLTEIIDRLKSEYINVVSLSPIYQTTPWGVAEQQEDYFNQVIQIKTDFYPFELLSLTQKIEKLMGRNQKGDFQPRVADIDIIMFNDWQIHSELLTIPHKRFRERKFVLLPLETIAKEIIDPVTQLTIRELNENCKDEIDFKIVP